MSVQVTGEAELKRILLSLGKDMEDAMKKGVFLTAQQIRTHAIKSIQNQSFGTYVTRSRQGGGVYSHIAAAPNSAPNTDTGKLVSSIAVEMDGNKAEADVGSNLDYSAFLEMGTTQMEPRPWLMPAVNAERDNLTKNIVKVARAEIAKRAGK